MAGAPKGNKNALKHGLYAEKALAVVLAPRGARMGDGPSTALRSAQDEDGAALRGPMAAIRYLEEVMDEIFARLKQAEGEEFTRLANALSLAATSLFNGHRTVAYLTGGISPVEDALRELAALDFSED